MVSLIQCIIETAICDSLYQRLVAKRKDAWTRRIANADLHHIDGTVRGIDVKKKKYGNFNNKNGQ